MDTGPVGIFRRVLGRREVQVRFPTLTIGVRGTDFWGKSADNQEMVLLIEGSVALTRHSAADAQTVIETRQMQVPLSYLRSDQGGALVEDSASPEAVAAWATETEPDPQRPSGRAEGKFQAMLFGALTQQRAASLSAQLRELGYPVEVTPYAPAIDAVTGVKRQRFAVVLKQLGSAAEVKDMRQRLRATMSRPRV